MSDLMEGHSVPPLSPRRWCCAESHRLQGFQEALGLLAWGQVLGELLTFIQDLNSILFWLLGRLLW